MRRPAIPLASAFVFGLAIASPLQAGTEASASAAALAVALLVAGARFAGRDRLLAGSAVIVAAFSLLGLSAAAARSQESRRRTLLPVYRRAGERSFVRPSRVGGRLRREAARFPDFSLLTLDADWIEAGRVRLPVEGGIRARVSGEQRARLGALATGDRVTLWGRLEEPAFFANPGGIGSRSFLERERLDLFASVKSALLVEPGKRAPLLESLLSRLRVSALERIGASLGERGRGDTFGLIVAMVTGERSGLSPSTQELYREAGILHVIAISGAHVAIVAMALYFVLRRLGTGEVTTLVLLLVLLPLYAAFCGSGAPVVRAALTACAVVGARLLSLDGPRGNALALAALLLLAWEPSFITDAGFQLSFGAMAGILWLSEALSLRLGWLRGLAAPMAATLAAQAAVVPITAWHFHALTPAAPLASLVAIPLAGALTILGFGLVAFAGVPLVQEVAAFSAWLVAFLLTGTARLSTELPLASIAIARPGALWIVSYFLCLAAARLGSRPVGAAGVTGLVVLLVRLPFTEGGQGVPEAARRHRLEITALDVGHGDAIVVRLPEGQRILVDGGGLLGSSLDVGRRVILPYLLDHGGRRLEAVVATHGDFDHAAGLAAVVDSMRVGEIWEGPESKGPSRSRALEALHAAAGRRGTPVRRLGAGEVFELGGVRFEILAAGGVEGLASPEAPLPENERSVFMRLTYGDSRVLLTGDAGRELEDALLRRAPERLEAEVLKVGHHGSRGSTSAAFLEAVNPRLAILSTRGGTDRPLPSTRILNRLRAFGIDYLRTDESGAVSVFLDEEGGLEVETYRSAKRMRY
jgi:competence protein ComEC